MSKYNSQKIEGKWQEKWEDAQIFNANPIPNKEKKFITVPYPYTSGVMHIGHGRAFVNGDVFARYYRAKGFNTLFPMAFHITGTPVLSISSSIERGNQKIINRMKDYVSLHTTESSEVDKIVDSFKEPWNVVKYFSKVMKIDLKGIGMSLDWRREFTTGDKEYNRFIEWQFHHLKKEGYIEKGEYPILYCPRDKNAVGEDDIKSGDEFDLKINEYTCIKFPYKDGFLVASTLRPETIFGVTNLWLNPEGEYVKGRIEDEYWYISKQSLQVFKNQGKNIEDVDHFCGRKIIGEFCSDVFGMKNIPILPADFVSLSMGTGVVYSVPAHAPYDYIALVDLQRNKERLNEFDLDVRTIELIYPIEIIDLKGIREFPAKYFCEQFEVENQEDREKLDLATAENYKEEFYNGVLNEKCGKYQGLIVNEAAKTMKNDLIEENKATILYVPVTKGLKCKCGEDVIVSILQDQWFLNYNAEGWKDLAYDCLENMMIVPEKYRLNFENVFDWLEKRPCARKRGLGTKLPFDNEWIIESLSDSTIYMAFYTIKHLLNKYKIMEESLTISFFDYVFLGQGNVDKVSKETSIDQPILQEIRKEFDYWYPLDHRHTAIMHISNHLSFFIFHHIGIFPKKYYPKLITLIEPVIRDGQKMGKSKGNVINLYDVQERYSADLFRIFICHSADLSVQVDWTEGKINSVKEHISRFYRFVMKRIQEFKNQKNVDVQLSDFSKSILSQAFSKIERSRIFLDNYNLRGYLQVSFYELFSLLRQYNKSYVDISEINKFFSIIIPYWVQMLSFTMPHIGEEIWEKMGNKGFISESEIIPIEDRYRRPKLERELEYIENLLEDVRKIRRIIKEDGIGSIYVYTAPLWKYEVEGIIVREKGNFKVILRELKKNSDLSIKDNIIKFIKSEIRNRVWQREKIEIQEKQVIEKYKSYLEDKTKAKIILNDDYDPKKKKNFAAPFRPALYIEE